MKIGVNWLAPTMLPKIRELIDQRVADFCEIMVDNFVHIPAAKIRAALPEIPIAFHIVSSRFLEKDLDSLRKMAKHLKPWLKDVEAMYVSDHLGIFMRDGKTLPYVDEIDYEEEVLEKINLWQNLLDHKVYFENHASLSAKGSAQPAFYQKILKQNAGVLFDFSNAYIAELNQVCDFSKWHTIILECQHFHVAGFTWNPKSSLYLDTHDKPIHDNVYKYMQNFKNMFNNAQKSIVLEATPSIDLNFWKNEIVRLKNNLEASIYPFKNLLESNTLLF